MLTFFDIHCNQSNATRNVKEKTCCKLLPTNYQCTGFELYNYLLQGPVSIASCPRRYRNHLEQSVVKMERNTSIQWVENANLTRI